MIRIYEIKLPVETDPRELPKKVSRLLRIPENDILKHKIFRRSLDARKKPQLFYVYTVDLELRNPQAVRLSGKHNNIMSIDDKTYVFPKSGSLKMAKRPVIVGSGPAGLFCAYLMALHGYQPILIERGDPADIRTQKVESFWKEGCLDTESNVQFGEGGAGTFSDGKLNTSVKDPMLRGQFILQTFVKHGAPEEILYDQKPHLGTDVLKNILISMREEIVRLGGTYRFRSTLTNLIIENGKLKALEINHDEILSTDTAVLCLGHSARDTFPMLFSRGISMQPKAFAVGVRIEHPQAMIDFDQYGRARGGLDAAAYKLTHTCKDGRGVYTFCMCPGGYVVNASSEGGFLAVNGMSYQKRNSANANSAVVVTVTPEDCASYASGFSNRDLFPGIAFQRKLEKLACEAAGGRVPIQLFMNFRDQISGASFGDFEPCIRGQYAFGRVDTCLPDSIREAVTEGITVFGRKIKGFDRDDAIISGVESRTSSPLRILRNEDMEAAVTGVYPAGEGAGYAGGIMSAAMDGMKAAEAIAGKFKSI